MAIDGKLMEDLRKQAARGTLDEADDFNPYDMSGGNFDDAYWAGQEDGETKLARRVLASMSDMDASPACGPNEGGPPC